MLKSIVGYDTGMILTEDITSILKRLYPFRNGSVVDNFFRVINEFQGIANPYCLFTFWDWWQGEAGG